MDLSTSYLGLALKNPLVPSASPLARTLRLAARLCRAEGGPPALWLKLGGFDTHRGQANAIRRPLGNLSSALGALKAGLGDNWERTAVICMTEFGRTARQNGTNGTDHGTGGVMFFAGGALAGAKVHGRWPGLRDGDLVRVDAVAGTLDILTPGVLDRPAVRADLSAHQHGTGRELFAAFRHAVGSAEGGASIFGG